MGPAFLLAKTKTGSYFGAFNPLGWASREDYRDAFNAFLVKWPNCAAPGDASAALGGVGLAEGQTMSSQAIVQLTGIVAVLIWSVVVSFLIIKVVQALIGLRVSAEVEEQGLDLNVHGERGYNM